MLEVCFSANATVKGNDNLTLQWCSCACALYDLSDVKQCKIRQTPRVKKALVIMCLRSERSASSPAGFASVLIEPEPQTQQSLSLHFSESVGDRGVSVASAREGLCGLASARNAFTACNRSMSRGRPAQRPRGQIWQPAARLPFTFTPVITAMADEACFISLLLTEGKTHPRETPLAPAHSSSITPSFSLLKPRWDQLLRLAAVTWLLAGCNGPSTVISCSKLSNSRVWR